MLVAEGIINVLNTSCNLVSEYFKINITVPAKKPPKPKPSAIIVEKDEKIIKPVPIDEKVVPKEKDSIVSTKPIVKLSVIDTDKLAKTHKQVIIVKDGYKIITDKVWIDGAIGKYVQTSEKVTKQGHNSGDIIIDETLYYKSAYGYNCVKRTYRIKSKL